MKLYKDECFVLKSSKLGDADKLVVLFSKNNGRIDAIAKGAAKILSRIAGSLDTLNKINAQFYKGKNLDTLTEITLIDDYAEIKKDLHTIADIFYLLELILSFTKYLDDSESLYKMFSKFLDIFRENSDKGSILIRSLELQLLAQLGFGPILDTCLHSGRRIVEGDKRVAASGGYVGYLLLNEIHSQNDYSTTTIPDNILKIQKFLLSNDLEDALQLRVTKIQENTLKSVHRIWLQGILEQRLKSMTFIDQINESDNARK